ncbi:DUF2063 domain-containing protein [Thiohalocapsa marina]|uniref:DUF2063 domain-containing protein n=1 Tax=Thiohalocapsa marina TaxID=424902 RepID=A0A5M8FJN1_9GAMM|nr:putative DNA-binding domain-containing protein [Thiohalocapsa marina]KAA6184190.1 DUF2063 domain-containing protein [Thiohalocapsa marina]
MDKAGLAQTQREFARHLRDPAHCPAPDGIDAQRMAVYRDLVLNTLSGLLAGSFPVLRRLLSASQWQALVRDFLSCHRCHTPLFLELAQEFLDYLGNERTPAAEDPPFLLELAHYEWVELALSVSDEDPDPALADAQGDLLSGRPLLTPLLWNLCYRFPVHRIGPDYRLPPSPSPDPAPGRAADATPDGAPGTPPTRLLVWRDQGDRVRFLQINALTQRLIQLLQEPTTTNGRALLEQIAAELDHPDPDAVVSAGARLLLDLRERQVILGTCRDQSAARSSMRKPSSSSTSPVTAPPSKPPSMP